MAYNVIDKRGEQNVKQDDMLASKRFVIERKPDTVFFYELEEAVVLDVVMDEKHPIFSKFNLDPDSWPPNADGSQPNPKEYDYSWIGKIRFRFLNSEVNLEKTALNWASPLENTGVVEYPLMNEIVIVGKYMDQYFYTKKINANSTINANALFSAERNSGLVDNNINTFSTDGKFAGKTSTMNFSGGDNYTGILGSYFKFNPNIKMIKPYEGDTILQSRFGSSIRFGAYDDNRNNDNGKDDDYADGGGNPMILIRNRQAKVTIQQGQNGKGYTLEDINNDGSSIHFTSGKTISKFQIPVGKPIISGRRPVTPPKFDGDQIVINSDRIIMSAKANEMLFFSKKRIALVTDDEISLDCTKRLTLTSMKTATINAPKVYLGEHAKPYEPALLGRSTVLWLYTLCDWMLLNVNTQIQMITALMTHFHLGFKGPTTPPLPPALVLWADQLQSLQASQISLIALQMQLSELMSSRVFLAGGID